MAEIQGTWLRQVWLVARSSWASPFFTSQSTIPFIRLRDRTQGIFIEEASHYCIIYSYDRLPRATTSLPPAKVGTTKCNVPSLQQ